MDHLRPVRRDAADVADCVTFAADAGISTADAGRSAAPVPIAGLVAGSHWSAHYWVLLGFLLGSLLARLSIAASFIHHSIFD